MKSIDSKVKVLLHKAATLKLQYLKKRVKYLQNIRDYCKKN